MSEGDNEFYSVSYCQTTENVIHCKLVVISLLVRLMREKPHSVCRCGKMAKPKRNEVVSFRLDAETNEKLKQLAEGMKVTQADVVRASIAWMGGEYLPDIDREQCLETLPHNLAKMVIELWEETDARKKKQNKKRA
mgnify:CR=1 FL=1